MNDKVRKIVGIVSILFIIGLFVYSGLPSLEGKSFGEILPMLVTLIFVTTIKVGIVYAVIIFGKKIVEKINQGKKGKDK